MFGRFAEAKGAISSKPTIRALPRTPNVSDPRPSPILFFGVRNCNTTEDIGFRYIDREALPAEGLDVRV